ncbi:ATP-dependent RNA helicase [Occultella gossypii]|uniref:RNA helicase n=1 Tax=Occultella gossypii TaxID=2800820 RepID=A0ABS7S402_9MICO|nr:ATP-dependent helicase C-terminal domain-containing protein [Occultella gossypii]MBZ2195050.1 ATP-dependent helicase HrpB [Occultella gossypii]
MPPEPIARLLATPPDYPVVAGLPDVVAAARHRGVAVVQAPPGTGKTTLVPPALAAAVPGRIVVTQPRRIAARAAARRLAGLLGEGLGQTVGYSVRGDRHVGPGTRIEFVTTGLLLRRLQADPDLPGVGAVILDEVHERQLDADLTLALCVDVRTNLREDLPVIAMSATVAAELTAQALGGTDPAGPAPVITVPGILHPVREHWKPPPTRVARTDERGITRPFLEHVAATARMALADTDGDILVFVPGAYEVDTVCRSLAGAGGVGADVRPLHGRLSGEQQDLALNPGPRRRVVVSTAVAESSLTVPGVRVVVDAGFARRPRTDHRRGLAGLVTTWASRAETEQRAGRAGREGPGAVYRCWSQGDHARLDAHPVPEIQTADLTAFALELACWGSPDGAGLALLDEPPPTALAAARETLTGLGALDTDGRLTERGRAISAVGTDPRLARALLDASAAVGARRAAEVVAMLAEDTRAPGGDLVAALRALRRGGPATRAWRDQADRLARRVGRRPGKPALRSTAAGETHEPTAREAREPAAAGETHEPAAAGETSKAAGRGSPGARATTTGAAQSAGLGGTGAGDRRGSGVEPPGLAFGGDLALGDDLAVGLVVALAHPDRIARRRPNSTAYLMASGTGASLPDGALAGLEWLAVADADRTPGRRDATIRSAAPLDADLARLAAPALLRSQTRVTWERGRVVARRGEWLGAIELSSAPVPDPAPELVRAAVREGIAAEGLGVLRWTDAGRALRARLRFLRAAMGEPWPDVSDEALLRGLDSWLGPDLARVRGTGALARIDTLAALRRLLPWPEATHLEEWAPERVKVPSGSSIRVDYSADQPVVAVKLQEAFGWHPPLLARGRVGLLVHLLSPAGRPAAITGDLDSFWDTGYPQVRADLRGRYPKHAWPEDPRTATAHRGTSRRS